MSVRISNRRVVVHPSVAENAGVPSEFKHDSGKSYVLTVGEFNKHADAIAQASKSLGIDTSQQSQWDALLQLTLESADREQLVGGGNVPKTNELVNADASNMKQRISLFPLNDEMEGSIVRVEADEPWTMNGETYHWTYRYQRPGQKLELFEEDSSEAEAEKPSINSEAEEQETVTA